MTERNFWFVTRPLRDPQYHADGLRALQKATNNFTLKWTRNRPLHQKYEQCLVDAGMKQNNISHDGSGGRTWVAMLKTYCYVYEDSNGYLKPTKVAKAILVGKKVPENICKQVLTLQIPNSYFIGPTFRPKFSKYYRIQPIIFLILLANSKLLDKYITKNEIILFAMTAKRNEELKAKIKQILKYRKNNDEEKAKIEIQIFNDNGDISRADSRGDFSKYVDVANTFTILCRFTGFALADSDHGGLKGINDPKLWEKFEHFCNRYPFNSRIDTDPQFYTLSAGLDVDTYKTQYGINATPASRARKRNIKAQQLLKDYPQPEDLGMEELTTILSKEFIGFKAQKIAEDIKSRNFKVTSDSFVDSYLHEEDNLEFERKTARILRGMGLMTEMHPDPTTAFNNVNENIDLLAETNDEDMILVDAKNYSRNFNLSAALRNVMANSYIEGYKGYDGLNPKYYCYVTANTNSNEKNLQKINELALKNSGLEVHGMMISASALYWLLNYCSENDIPEENRPGLFVKLFQDKSYESFVQVAKALNIHL
ncbi:AlwI family type II restriction endonuclease [Liquorilactobacillus sicerae]|uniref:AlwI family type II restriction endonuclease n=1 Tax=Liquorilactobacillus sicerae TaxID=1416943 RepID=UPI002480834E|nr:AlwI family type II restriction endonuclease [Liquorilactobacillus sicerae]